MKSLVAAFIGLSVFTASVAANSPKIAWYGSLKTGLADAKTTGRPILLVSAAPHCEGVSGMW